MTSSDWKTVTLNRYDQASESHHPGFASCFRHLHSVLCDLKLLTTFLTCSSLPRPRVTNPIFYRCFYWIFYEPFISNPGTAPTLHSVFSENSNNNTRLFIPETLIPYCFFSLRTSHPNPSLRPIHLPSKSIAWISILLFFKMTHLAHATIILFLDTKVFS